MRVLFICTANQCRSPIAEAFLRSHLPRHGTIEAASAGLMAGGYPMPAEGVARMRLRGFDLSGHVSQQVTPALSAEASLILGMSRRHVRSIVAEDPSTRPRCYALKDFIRRSEAYDYGDGYRLSTLLDAFDADRPTVALLGRSHDDDISDPMGRPAAVWDAVVSEIDDQVARLAAVLHRMVTDSAA